MTTKKLRRHLAGLTSARGVVELKGHAYNAELALLDVEPDDSPGAPADAWRAAWLIRKRAEARRAWRDYTAAMRRIRRELDRRQGVAA